MIAPLLAFLLVFSFAAGAWANDDVLLEAAPAALTRVATDGHELWRIRHASLESARGSHEEPTSPIVFGDRAYYGVSTQLIEANVEDGRIVRRVYMPGKLVDIEPKSNRLMIQIRVEGWHEPLSIPFDPASDGPDATWDGTLGFMMPWKDAAHLAELEGDVSVADRRESLRALTEAESRDPGNPFYALVKGRVHQLLDEDELATAAFARAASIPSSAWQDELTLASRLNEARQFDLATKVHARALENMDEAQVDRAAHSSLVEMVTLMGWHLKPIEDAVAADEFERVDTLSRQIAETFPYVEMGAVAWKSLADWYLENGEVERARAWNARAEEAAKSPWNLPVRDADLGILVMFACSLGLPLGAFLVGLRSTGDMLFVPRPRALDLLGLVAITIVFGFAAHTATANVAKIGVLAAAPLPAFMDGYGSPAVIEWTENLAPSEARDQLLAAARTAQADVLAGKREPRIPDAPNLLLAAIDAESNSKASYDPTQIFALSSGISGGDSPPFARLGWLLIPGWLLTIGFWLLAGNIIASFLPSARRWLQRLAPGGAKSAGPLTPLFGASLIAVASALLFKLDSMLTTIAMPNFGKYFGLGAIVDFEIPRGWMLPTAVCVLALHALTTFIDWKRGDGSFDESNT